MESMHSQQQDTMCEGVGGNGGNIQRSGVL